MWNGRHGTSQLAGGMGETVGEGGGGVLRPWGFHQLKVGDEHVSHPGRLSFVGMPPPVSRTL